MGGNALEVNKHTRYRVRPETWSVVKFEDEENPPEGVHYDPSTGIWFLHTPSGRSEVVASVHYIVTDMIGTQYVVRADVWEATHEEIE